MYKVGQKIKIGYKVGSSNEAIVKVEAEVINIHDPFIWIKVPTNTSEGFRNEFRTEQELKELEANYNEH